MKLLISTALLSFLSVQSPAPKQAAQPRPRPRTPPVTHVVVRDQSGSPLAGTHVIVSGAASKESTTDANGGAAFTPMPDGTYRLRFEHDGFVLLEREVTLKNGQPSEIAVVLNPAAGPSPTPAPVPTPTPAVGPQGPPVTLSIPAFLDKNFIGREPLKESVLGCTGDTTTRLLQIRDGIAPHTHAGLDEVLYLVAGDGTVKIGAQSVAISAGSLAVVPRGLSHGLERRGKNPLIVLSMLSGSPCQPTPANQSGR